MSGLDKIREAMTNFLTQQGVTAITAWPLADKRRLSGPLAAVSLRSCESGPGGFQDYLGERYDRTTGSWQELYGRKVKAVFGLDLYAPREGGAAACQAAFDVLTNALNTGGPEGLAIKEVSRGEVAFDRDLGVFKCAAQAVCEAWIYAVADEGGAFLDFEVKGEKR